MTAGTVNKVNFCTFIHGPERMRIFAQHLFRFRKSCRIQCLAISADPFQGGIQTVVPDPVAEQHIDRRVKEVRHFYEQVQLGL